MITLKLDFDSPVPRDLLARVTSVTVALRARVQAIEVERTRRGYHVTVTCSGRASSYAVVAAQAICGSDWQREGFNLGRVRGVRTGSRNARDCWNVLYTRKISLPTYMRRV